MVNKRRTASGGRPDRCVVGLVGGGKRRGFDSETSQAVPEIGQMA